MLLKLIIIATALAMDCFSVSVASATILRQIHRPTMFRLAVAFGLFQAIMPLIGWFGVSILPLHFEIFGRYVAFLLLAYTGGRMIYNSIKIPEHPFFNPKKLRTQLLLAVATSIDAFSIGISMAITEVQTFWATLFAVSIIGFFSFFFSIIGYLLGYRIGQSVVSHVRPEFIGGILLLLISLNILFE